MSDGYRKQRSIYGNYSGSLLVTPFVGPTATLVVVKPASNPISPKDASDGGYTIMVQRVHMHISGGQTGLTWQVQDSNGNSLTGPVSTTSNTTTVGQDTSIPTQDPIQAEYDFGPEGIALSAGANLQFVASGTGATGLVTWDAYQRLTSAAQTFGA